MNKSHRNCTKIIAKIRTRQKSLVSLGPVGLHGVLLHHAVVVGVDHVPVVVHLGQVDRLAGHVKVVEILERESEVIPDLELNLPRDQ